MRNKILVVGGIAFVAYILGSRAARSRTSESVGHQVVRLWSDPKATKARKKSAKKIAKAASKRGEKLAKASAKRARRVASTVKSASHDIKKKLK